MDSLLKKNKDIRGASMVEYTVGLGALMIALLAPVFNGKNSIEMLEAAIKSDYSTYSDAVSRPR